MYAHGSASDNADKFLRTDVALPTTPYVLTFDTFIVFTVLRGCWKNTAMDKYLMPKCL